MRGGYSLSRQLGLGIARIVIDPGHGGHDPGAKVRGLTEADLVLDIALRLEALLTAQPGVEVVLTRRTNSYVPLEDRTDIANRAGADLFLSIHANASANTRATGIETYFLNFAPTRPRRPPPPARTRRRAARCATWTTSSRPSRRTTSATSRATSPRWCRRACAVRRGAATANLRNLGVKQAPFMVLIGATMPTVLTEISFITNRQELGLLEDGRQSSADSPEGLLAGVDAVSAVAEARARRRAELRGGDPRTPKPAATRRRAEPRRRSDAQPRVGGLCRGAERSRQRL